MMQNRVNLELERMLIPYKDKIPEEEKEKIYTFICTQRGKYRHREELFISL